MAPQMSTLSQTYGTAAGSGTAPAPYEVTPARHAPPRCHGGASAPRRPASRPAETRYAIVPDCAAGVVYLWEQATGIWHGPFGTRLEAERVLIAGSTG